MTLADIRKYVTEMSGRFDLVSSITTYTPATVLSVDFFIELGQNFLDDEIEVPGSIYIHSEALTVGNYEFDLPRLRYVEEIYYKDTAGKIVFLVGETHEEFLEEYGDEPYTEATQGAPAYWREVFKRSSSAATANKSNLERFFHVYPPVDASYTLKIKGAFYTPVMTETDDENFWSRMHPQILIQAALYSIERFYRNTAGMNDHLAAIERDLQKIDHNMVQSGYTRRTTMRNSW